MIYDINGNPVLEEIRKDINCKIIAHRGYHVIAKQNTIDAFKDASKEGFSWVEVDIRKTADGIYVMSHDNAVTMYNNGSAVSVNITNSNYETIKNYTWDSAGQYKLCTLQAVFNAMKVYDMKIICDRKTGTNAEIMDIATMCGAVDRVLLSYGSFAQAHADVNLLKKYDTVPIRIYPSDYANASSVIEDITNPTYADINATSVNNNVIQTAMACGIPIIFSGCTRDNYPIWSVLASGCMANLDLNISYDDFYEMLNNDYDVVSTITPSVESVSVARESTANVTAQSNVSTRGGYVYGYTLNPAIASVVQLTFGSSVSFTITGVSAGSTTLRLFTGSGEIVEIPVVVS